MVWDASDGYVLLFGGTSLTSYFSDTWTYSNGVWTNVTASLSGGSPPNVDTPGLTYDPWTGVVLLFGGFTASSDNLSLTWSYHDGTWTNLTSTAGTPPAPRTSPVFVADLASHEMILYGGSDRPNGIAYTDTWLFSGSTWSNITGTVGSSPPAMGISGAFDPAESGILIFGFTGTVPVLGYTYVFTEGHWRNLTANLTVPTPLLEFGRSVYFAPAQTLLVVASIAFVSSTGGAVAFPEVWGFTDGNWTNLTGNGPIPASGTLAAGAADGSGAVLIFGGYAALGIDTQWMYAYSNPPGGAALTATPAALDAGGRVDFTSSFSGGLAPYFVNISFGDGTPPGPGPNTTHLYVDVGTHQAELNVSDLLDRAATATATVVVNADPSGLSIQPIPPSPSVGATVNFSAAFSGGTPPYTSDWQFGDGSTSAAVSPSHLYARAGTYTVNLTITDTDGRMVNASTTIHVAGASSSSSGSSPLWIYAALVVLFAVVAIVAAVVLRRRRRPPMAADGTAAESGSPAPPPGVAGPPPSP